MSFTDPGVVAGVLFLLSQLIKRKDLDTVYVFLYFQCVKIVATLHNSVAIVFFLFWC